MRFVALALILGLIPFLINLLRQDPAWRRLALTGLGLALFFGDNLRIEASIIGWPLWNGTARGIEISPVDAIAIALLVTRRRTGLTLPFWGVLAFYGATLLMSFIPSAVWMATLFSCWQFARVLLLFAAIGGECDRPEARTALLNGLSLGLMLQAGYVAQQKLSGVVQATGTMYHQNTLGMMVELALLPLVAALLAGDRSLLVKLGIGAGLIVIAGGGSRGAMGMAGGGLIALGLLSIIREVTPLKLKMVGLGAMALAIAVPLGLATLKDRFGSSSVITDERERDAFERAARAMAADHPIGVGANEYVPTANLKHYADRAGVAWNLANRSAPVHNAYLLARAETGWAGELALILLLVAPVAQGLRFAFRRRHGPAGEAALGSAIAIAVNIVHNNYEFALHTYNVLALLGVNLGVIGAQLRAERRVRANPGPGADAPASRIAPGLALAGHQPR